MLPSKLALSDTRVTDRLFMKYPCKYDCVWNTLIHDLVSHRQFYDLHSPLWNGKTTMTQETFQDYSILTSYREQISEALTDQAHAIACLASVDGAVVISDRFELLAFGAEVIAASPTLTHVMMDTGTPPMTPIPIESFGTRHRSAFRLCSSLEDTVAFVISQDGGVKAVKRVGSDVILWPDINAETAYI
jgi:hypothetical protein